MIATLGMYDFPAIRGATNRFWQAIRSSVGFGPAALTRDGDAWEIWQSPDLLLAQTCGMPYRTRLHGNVQLIGTPDYGLPGCPPGYYRSVFVARADAPGAELADFAGKIFAYNESLSQSGWAAPMTHAAKHGISFGALVKTGGHALSADAVAKGKADLAAIDALTWKLLCEHNPVTKNLRAIDTTEPTPGLPYITALGRDPAPIAAAIRQAIGDISAEDRAALHLKGLETIPAQTYLSVPTPPGP